jgi:hypothetical protein
MEREIRSFRRKADKRSSNGAKGNVKHTIDCNESPNPLIQREQAKRSVAVKVQPTATCIARIPKYAGDQKTGEGEKYVDTVCTPHLNCVDEAQNVKSGARKIAVVI